MNTIAKERMTAEVVDEIDLAIARGKRAFDVGKPWPPDPDDSAWGRNRESAEWIGYHVARARAFWKRRRVMETLGVEDDT